MPFIVHTSHGVEVPPIFCVRATDLLSETGRLGTVVLLRAVAN